MSVIRNIYINVCTIVQLTIILGKSIRDFFVSDVSISRFVVMPINLTYYSIVFVY